jgi:hypothetical protein
LYSQLEEEETREYEMGRIEQILGLDSREGAGRVEALVVPFYGNIVKSGVEQLRGAASGAGAAPLDGQKLQQWRQSLGVTEPQASKLHSRIFAQEVQRCVKAGKGIVREEHYEFLARVRGFLGISSFEAERSLEGVTAPLLRETIKSMLDGLATMPEAEWGEALMKVRRRQKELRMVDSALIFHIKDVYSEGIKTLLRRGVELRGEVDGDKLRELVKAALERRDLMHRLVVNQELQVVMDDDVRSFEFLNFAPGEFGRLRKEALFREYVHALVKAGKVDEEASRMNALGDYLKLKPEFVSGAVKSVVGPMYDARARQYVAEGELTPENRQSLQQLIQDFRVEDADVRATGLSLYRERVAKYFDAKKHFTEEELTDLDELRRFLLLTVGDVDTVHEPLARDELLAVLRAEFAKQRTVGSMTPEAQEHIAAMSRKLGMSESARDDLIGEAMTEHLEPLMEDLKRSYRRVTTPPEEAKGSKDEGEDPFIKGRKEGLMIKTDRNTNLMIEAVALVKFLDDNSGFTETMMNLDDEAQMVRPTDGRPYRQVPSFICKAHPSTMTEDEEDVKLAEEMYKAFVQTVAQSGDGEKKDRYRVVQDKFGALLGISPPRMEAIKFDLYAGGMRKMVRSVLEVKGMMGADDTAQLSKMNKDFGVDEERATRLVQTEKQKWLTSNLVAVLHASPNVMGPIVNRLRMTAASLGVDLSEDVEELTQGNRDYMFKSELTWMLESGPDDVDVETVPDMAEAYGVYEAVAEQVMEKSFKEASRQVCVDLMGNLNRDDYVGAFRDLNRLVRIARMVPLPLNFGGEAFLGMSSCAGIAKLWKSYGVALGKSEASPNDFDMSGMTASLSDADKAALARAYDSDENLVIRLISGLKALPDAAPVDELSIDYRGRKVVRKHVKPEEAIDTDPTRPEELGQGEEEMMAVDEDAPTVKTMSELINVAIDTQQDYSTRRKKRFLTKDVVTKQQKGGDDGDGDKPRRSPFKPA